MIFHANTTKPRRAFSPGRFLFAENHEAEHATNEDKNVFDFAAHRSTIVGQSRTALTGFFYFLIHFADLV
jgi:hypothetical protein